MVDATSNTRKKNLTSLPLAIVALSALALYLLYTFVPEAHLYSTEDESLTIRELALRLVQLLLWLSLAFALVHIASALLFGVLFRRLKGYEAPGLARDIIAIIAYVVVFALIFKLLFRSVPLGALFTTSTVVGVILGLALQDTLGNLFAGVSLHADKPFQVGDVIKVGQHTGVVESITWRAVKLRTFQNNIVLVSNSTTAKESIEVYPRENLNARLVYFSTLYTDSPVKVIHIVREAVREAVNVSQKITPVVRIRNLSGDSVDYEIKYWLEDYARYNDTDALVRQRVWYAFRRAGISFSFPTQTITLERRAAAATNGDASTSIALLERLAGVDIFAPLSSKELARLAASSHCHVFAPGETIIRAGDTGASMFIVHRGSVEVQVADNGYTRTVAQLGEGDFFGEMALFTGEPRTANVLATEETEVLEVSHAAMKHLFDTDPALVESIGHTITERRDQLLLKSNDSEIAESDSDGLLSSIKRFFGLS